MVIQQNVNIIVIWKRQTSSGRVEEDLPVRTDHYYYYLTHSEETGILLKVDVTGNEIWVS